MNYNSLLSKWPTEKSKEHRSIFKTKNDTTDISKSINITYYRTIKTFNFFKRIENK
jgi:hypothetical protein